MAQASQPGWHEPASQDGGVCFLYRGGIRRGMRIARFPCQNATILVRKYPCIPIRYALFCGWGDFPHWRGLCASQDSQEDASMIASQAKTALIASVPEPYISGYASDSERAQRVAEYRAVCRLADALAREASDLLTDTSCGIEFSLASLIARALCTVSPDAVNPIAVLTRAIRMC